MQSVEMARVHNMLSQPVSSMSSSKLCRKISIESPLMKYCVFSFEVPVPGVPPTGARLRVEYAGACYRLQYRAPSQAGDGDDVFLSGQTGFAHYGVRDAAFFPGYEVAGVVEALGVEVPLPSRISVGDRVVLYPFEGVPHGYAEYMEVPDLQYLVKVPDSMPLSVAAMLPTGALWAMNTVQEAKKHVLKRLEEQGDTGRVRVLVVGTGGLALWALRLFDYYLKDVKDRVLLVVACLRDDGVLLAKEAAKSADVVLWNEDCYERVLIERTKSCCNGEVDVVVDFGTTSRSLQRSLQCLSKGGVAFISPEVSGLLTQKFGYYAEERQQSIKTVDIGTIGQLTELVGLIASGEISPPPHTVYPAEQAREVVRQLCNSEIRGRAILSFNSIQ